MALPFETEAFEVGSLIAVLDQLVNLLMSLDDPCYIYNNAELKCGAIGGHTRHVIDHVFAVTRSVEEQLDYIDYDSRERLTPVETDPLVAIASLREAILSLQDLKPASLEGVKQSCLALNSSGKRVCIEAVVKRELAFVFSHTVHHMAIIGVLARAQGVTLPASFGLAPSTTAYRESTGND